MSYAARQLGRTGPGQVKPKAAKPGGVLRCSCPPCFGVSLLGEIYDLRSNSTAIRAHVDAYARTLIQA